MHLRKGNILCRSPHCIDIHELRIIHAVMTCDHITERICGIDTRQTRNIQQHRLLMQDRIVPHRLILYRTGVNDVAELSVFHQMNDLIIFRRICDRGNCDSHRPDGICRTGCRIQLHSKIMELAGHIQDFLIVMGIHTDQHPVMFVAAQIRYAESRRGQTFEQRFRKRSSDAEHFSGALHLRSEDRIGITQFFKGEDRHLDAAVRRNRMQTGSIAKGHQILSQHDIGRKIHHRHSGHLRNIRHRPAGPRIHFNDVQFPAEDQILNIHKTPCIHCQGQLFRDFDHAPQILVIQVVRRIDGNRVAGMHAGTLNMFHDAGDQHIRAVRDDIHFEFRSRKILIDQHRVLNALRKDASHIFPGIRFPVGNRHILSADDIGRPQQHRITEFFRCLNRFFQRLYGSSLRPAHLQCFQQCVEPFPVFRKINTFG